MQDISWDESWDDVEMPPGAKDVRAKLGEVKRHHRRILKYTAPWVARVAIRNDTRTGRVKRIPKGTKFALHFKSLTRGQYLDIRSDFPDIRKYILSHAPRQLSLQRKIIIDGGVDGLNADDMAFLQDYGRQTFPMEFACIGELLGNGHPELRTKDQRGRWVSEIIRRDNLDYWGWRAFYGYLSQLIEPNLLEWYALRNLATDRDVWADVDSWLGKGPDDLSNWQAVFRDMVRSAQDQNRRKEDKQIMRELMAEMMKSGR